MSEKLKPCPCGEIPIIDEHPRGRYWVGCYSKHCNRLFEDGLETRRFSKKSIAIKAWNRWAK